MQQSDQDRFDGWQAARRGDECAADASPEWREGFAIWQPKTAHDAMQSALAAIDALVASPSGQACKAAFARQDEAHRKLHAEFASQWGWKWRRR